MARVHLSSPLSRVSLKYANDSTEVDSTAERDYVWTQFTINEYSCQKISIFEKDYSGTYLSGIIDNENASSPYTYVQGMTGVNTRLSFTKLQDWIDSGQIVVNSATLIFDVVPDVESGIIYEDLPQRLILFTELVDGDYMALDDYIALDYNKQNEQFGGILKAESEGMFFDTTYIYRFNIPLHFQAMISGEKTNNNFILQVYDADRNPRFTKLWSSFPDNRKRIRLEVVYLKL